MILETQGVDKRGTEEEVEEVTDGRDVSLLLSQTSCIAALTIWDRAFNFSSRKTGVFSLRCCLTGVFCSQPLQTVKNRELPQFDCKNSSLKHNTQIIILENFISKRNLTMTCWQIHSHEFDTVVLVIARGVSVTLHHFSINLGLSGQTINEKSCFLYLGQEEFCIIECQCSIAF